MKIPYFRGFISDARQLHLDHARHFDFYDSFDLYDNFFELLYRTTGCMTQNGGDAREDDWIYRGWKKPTKWEDFKNGLKLREKEKKKVGHGSVADLSKDWF